MSFASLIHASYFLASQDTMGYARERAIAPALGFASRPLSRVMAELAKLEEGLAAVEAAVCRPDCSGMRRKATALRARQAALDEEERETRQEIRNFSAYQLAKDRLRADPALWRIANALSLRIESLQLALGLLVGVLLDCVG